MNSESELLQWLRSLPPGERVEKVDKLCKVLAIIFEENQRAAPISLKSHGLCEHCPFLPSSHN